MDLKVKPLPQRRIKLNRDLGRKTSTDTPAPAGLETPDITTSARKTSTEPPAPSNPETSTSTSSGERVAQPTPPPGSGDRRERPASGDRRERPPSGDRRERLEAGERAGESARDERKERPGSGERGGERREEREMLKAGERRERPSSGDRRARPGSCERGGEGAREERRTVTSGGGEKLGPGGLERVAVTVERGAGGGGRSVSLDRMTIGERSAITKEKPGETTQEKPAGAKSRPVSRERPAGRQRPERGVSSADRPTPGAPHRDATSKDSLKATGVVKTKPEKTRTKLTRKADHTSSSRPAEPALSSSRSAGEKDPGPVRPPHQGGPSLAKERNPALDGPLIQAPPRSKWERDDLEGDEEEELKVGGDEEEESRSGSTQSRGSVGSAENGVVATSHQKVAPKPEASPAPPRRRGREDAARGKTGGREERKGGARVERRGVKEGKAARDGQLSGDSKPAKAEARGGAKEDRGVREGGKEESRGVRDEGRGGGGVREESRGPEPRRQRLCSDLGRETDEAAFVPDYSEGEGSEAERGRSLSPTGSHASSQSHASQSPASQSPAPSNRSGSANTTAAATTTAEKKKKKHKKHKKHKHKHRKHEGEEGVDGHDKEAEPKEHKHKHKKKKKHKHKNKERDRGEGEEVAEENGE